MKRFAGFCLALPLLQVFAQQPQPKPAPPSAEEKRQIQSKTDELAAVVRKLRARHLNEDLLADLEVYEKAGRMALEFPDEFLAPSDTEHTLAILQTGLERGRQLESGQSPWTSGKGRRALGMYSALDGSVQPYGVTLPDSYDGATPARLYVWMHGRAAKLTETDFLFSMPNPRPAKPPVADVGQVVLDVYGRWNGAGWHFAGEVDVFEAIAAVRRRYKIDPARIVLRGFSMGGEGAWHIALHHPDRFAAAEIGAGTVSRRLATTPDLAPYQKAVLRIWENIPEWALNVFNLPLAGHGGDMDPQRESSVRARDQLAKEGFVLEGEPDDLRARGTPAIFQTSRNTGHSTSPEVRARLDAFLKKYGDRGQVSPDHIRFLTYTTRYNRDYWVTLAALEKHYERAEVDAQRGPGGRQYQIKTKNLARLELRETDQATEIDIDGQALRVKPAASMALEKSAAGWKVAGQPSGLRKVHGLQGPIDDAFLDPFLLVRPTGTAWNDAVNQQALRTLARFDRMYAKFLRAHPRVKDDRDVTAADLAKYHVALFGDPGSNRWIAKLNGKLPVRWTRDAVSLEGKSYPAADHYPALIYPNPLSPTHYVVLNSGLTIDDRGYRGDYGMPSLGDFAVLKAGAGEVGDAAVAGLFDEFWKFPKESSAAAGR